MPAIHFSVTWPDGESARYYSPSTTVRHHLSEKTYQQSEFHSAAETALNAASERVRETFGYSCTAASAELDKITQKLAELRTQGIDGPVQLTRIG
jgi:uncharacterized repeat protein (TIGR04042 family)